ncbi:MAG: hypothetical protein A2033_16625 [Bacteroidetes bacterium GWA2_31_9]|nr:MAG: hypothetical protein A2033_16625 [Bacteroidetes bacterium GWA2_31_9]
MKRSIFYLFIILIITSCTDNNQTMNKISIPQNNNLTVGLLMPITLNPSETTIYLQDYIADVSKIDSISVDSSLKQKLSVDKQKLTLISNKSKVPSISELNIYTSDATFTILLKKSLKESIRVFFINEGRHYDTIRIAGDFNNWNPNQNPLHFNGNIWETELLLNPGRFCYQFVVDGDWILDPANPDTVSNNMGGYNSVIYSGKTNFDSIPQLCTDNKNNNLIKIKVKNSVSEYFVLWQNYRLYNDYIKYTKDGIEIVIPEEAKNLKRSFIRVYSYNSYGISNDLLIPLDNGKVLENSELLTREDYEATVMYFLMVDRFNNGNPKNDEPADDPEVHEKSNYYGGDLIGITNKIKDGYFKELGVNALWISPITQNTKGAFVEFPEPHRKFSAYHGYWPISSSKVDYRFGTENELHQLVDNLHDSGINIFLDFVSNHVHKEHPLYKEHPEWATALTLPDGRKNIRLWDEQRLTTWFDTFLPTLNYDIPQVVDIMTDSALYWIKKFNLDGFRHDATKHIPENFWRELTYKLKTEIEIPEKKKLFQIGETFGSRELIGSYVSSGMLDGQFDFNLYFDMRQIFVKDTISYKRLIQSLNESFQYYGYHSLMGNVTGNHDLPRFISFASGDLSFEENDKEAGWNRNIKVKDTIGYSKLASLMTTIMTIPGIPVIYYGDEFGMPGAGDPDNRRMMKFNKLSKNESKLKEITISLIHLRRTNLALIYGDYTPVFSDDNTIVYCRKYFEKVVIVIINKHTNSNTIKFELPFDLTGKANVLFNSKIKIEENYFKVDLRNKMYEVIYNE